MASTTSSIEVIDLGLISYPDALQLQYKRRDERLAGLAPNTLFLLEHPPTVTVARASSFDGAPFTEDELKTKGLSVYKTERGGMTTYHGPGQIVGYVILDISQMAMKVHELMRRLEQTVIDTLRPLNINAGRLDAYPGVWVDGERKIAAVGVHLRRWVTIHGFALNVSPDMSHFEAIVPCGITDKGVTSIQKELGKAPGIGEMKILLAENFSKNFQR
ncbi:MAG: lipoyl(octanoyl) transferase LipB [Dehalococcoidia bacterium]|nr:lipoyl(octanoyl) transferase LipB [Dehalococcoidia bacterium]